MRKILRLRWAPFLLGAVMVIVVLAGMVLWLGRPPVGETVRQPVTSPVPSPVAQTSPTPAPTAAPTPEPTPGSSYTPVTIISMPEPERFVIPRLRIDAPVVVGTLTENGAMQDPTGPEEVMWYNFTPTPGSNGNAIVSGHRDYQQVGQRARAAVFWRIPELVPGDEIWIRTVAAEELRFIVMDTTSYETDKVPLDEVQAQGMDQILTIITCEGRFDPQTRDYDHRRVVRARLA